MIYHIETRQLATVIEKRSYNWVYPLKIQFADGVVLECTPDDISTPLQLGDKVKDSKGRFLNSEQIFVVEVDMKSDFPLKVSDGSVKRSYTLDGRYDFNSEIELCIILQ